MMTPREAFRFGFYYRCAEEGLGVPEARMRAVDGLEKMAEPSGILGHVGEGIGLMGKGLKTIGGLGLLTATALPIAAGTGVGLGLANMQEHDIDPDEVRRQELISAYRFHTAQARRRAMMRNLAGGHGTP